MISFLTIAGALALVGGSVGFFTFPMGVKMGIKMAINLKENGMVYPIYMTPPFPTKSTFYLFAIKNPREALGGKRKMSFERKGPYIFDTYLVRENVVFMKQGEKVQYESGRKLTPLEDQSANFDERMWLINPIVPTTVRSVRSIVIDRVPFQRFTEPIVFNAVNALLENFNERLILRTSPREILNGRKVTLLESLSGLAARFNLESLLPTRLPENTFGLAFVQNATVDRIEIWTGVGQSREKFADVSKWKEKTKLSAWPGKCSSISGTNGELFKPLIEQNSTIRVFLGPLCRSFHLTPVGSEPVIVQSGLRAFEFELNPTLFLGARSNPSNKCFCENPKSYDCLLDGLLAMGPCFFDSPLFFSRGNLKNVDDRIRRLVDYKSLERDPVAEKQSLYLEPMTGVVLEANVTLMALFKVTRQAYIRDLSKVQNLTYVPLFSTTESISVPFKYVWQIYYLQMFSDYHKPIMGGLALFGLGVVTMKLLFGL